MAVPTRKLIEADFWFTYQWRHLIYAVLTEENLKKQKVIFDQKISEIMVDLQTMVQVLPKACSLFFHEFQKFFSKEYLSLILVQIKDKYSSFETQLSTFLLEICQKLISFKENTFQFFSSQQKMLKEFFFNLPKRLSAFKERIFQNSLIKNTVYLIN